MKISKIEISKYHQFEDFKLDLTYPKGHEKAGKALDKVCFIGQSGTGKTTLLEILTHVCVSSHPDSRIQFDFGGEEKSEITLIFDKIINDREWAFFNFGSGTPVSKNFNYQIVDLGFYFPAAITNLSANKSLDIDKSNAPILKIVGKKKAFGFYTVDLSTLEEMWIPVFEDVKKYQEKKINYFIEVVNQAKKNKQDVKHEILQKWEKTNPDPLEKIGKECLDVILNKFYLAVKKQIDEIKEINTLQIYSLSDNTTVPFEKLSTGTKQIILTAFPIYKLLKKNSIILMDEPETSLYPDIQREIIPYYTSFDKEKTSQFFFATHSPIIASAFEPWEIVELKFDAKGKVYREKYYEGENHVDNYKIDPRYLRWDDILTKVFDLPFDSNIERAEKLTEYASLKNKVKKFREEGRLNEPNGEVRQTIEKFQKTEELLTGSWATIPHEKD